MNKIPDIELYGDVNPTICSPNSPYELSFYQTRETLNDIEAYNNFLQNAISRFRKSITYKHYKGYLIGLGLDRCQFHGNITNEMATIEMHHNMLTIFDIALIISEHILNTHGYISTFDLVTFLKQEHKANRIQLVMLSLTPHQLYHNNEDFFIDPRMAFGKWWDFLELYKSGVTLDIAYKVIRILDESLEKGGSDDNNLLNVRDKILDWSYQNEYGYDKPMH